MDDYQASHKLAYKFMWEYIRQNELFKCEPSEIASRLKKADTAYASFFVEFMDHPELLQKLMVHLTDDQQSD